ncbi:MAG: AMP-binding protein [Rhodobacteraceae bacterium]|nr:AMP-binding protein [Paracoccaceae bacterium]
MRWRPRTRLRASRRSIRPRICRSPSAARGHLVHEPCPALGGGGARRAPLRPDGPAPGDRVGVCLGNRAEWVLIDLACLHLGLVVAGFDPMKFVPSAALMDRYGLRVLVTEEAMPGTMPVTRLHDAPDPAWPLPPWPAYRAGDEVALKFTSGSTGAAKAIAATWGSIGMSLSAVEEMFDHGPGDTLFVFLTLSLLQQRYWVYTALLRGTDLVIATPQTALFALRAAQPSVIMGVPAFFETLKTLIETEADAAGCTPREAAKSATGGRVRYMWTGSAPIRPRSWPGWRTWPACPCSRATA